MGRQSGTTSGGGKGAQAGDALDGLGAIARSGECWLAGSGNLWPGGERGWFNLGQQLSSLAGADPRHCAELGRRWIASALTSGDESATARRFDLGWEMGSVALAIAEWRASVIHAAPWRPQWGFDSYYTMESDEEGCRREEIHCELVGADTLAPEDLEVWRGFCSLSDTYYASDNRHVSAQEAMEKQVGLWGLGRAGEHKEASRLVMVSLAYFEEAALGAVVVEAGAMARLKKERPRM